MSPLYSVLEDPSASEDFDFEIRVVPSVVSLPVDSCLLVSLANNRQVRFSMSFLSMLVVQVRRSCRWPLVCPSDRNVPRRCLRMHLCGVVLARGVPFLDQPPLSGRSTEVWPVLETLVLGVMEHNPRKRLEDRQFSAVPPFRSEQTRGAMTTGQQSGSQSRLREALSVVWNFLNACWETHHECNNAVVQSCLD